MTDIEITDKYESSDEEDDLAEVVIAFKSKNGNSSWSSFLLDDKSRFSAKLTIQDHSRSYKICRILYWWHWILLLNFSWVHCNYCRKRDQLWGETNSLRRLEISNPDINPCIHGGIWFWLVCTDPKICLPAFYGLQSLVGTLFELPCHSKN